MRWLRRWLLRLLVMLVLVGAVRHAYVSGMVGSALHSVEQSVMRQALEIVMAQDGDDGQAQFWRLPAQRVFGWLWARSSPLDREALVRYWRLRQLDDPTQSTGALPDAAPISVFEDGAPPPPFTAADRSPLPTIADEK